jgi:hypothetical protein
MTGAARRMKMVQKLKKKDLDIIKKSMLYYK